MSLSNPKISNPVSKFLEFKGDAGTFSYFDKSIGEKGENVNISYPFYFIVLDQLNTIKGFNESLNCGIYSNEVKNLSEEILTVKTFKKGVNIVGKYNDIKGEVVKEGGKFTKSIYAMWIKSKDEVEMINLQLKGAAFSSWFDAGINTDAFGVVVKSNKEGTKGKVVYQMPVFEKLNIMGNLEMRNKAIEIDRILQRFFKHRKEAKIEAEEAPEIVKDEIENDFIAPNEVEDDLVF